jgi:hypothetical protein
MPYRRLPNTDSARCRALLKAYQKGKETPPFKLAFTQSTYQKIVSFLPLYEKTIKQVQSAYSVQAVRSREYHKLMKKAKLYISHFIQVVNMAIQRGELPASIREYYSLNGNSNKLPPLTTEEDIIRWGKALIDGEAARILKGQSPVTNPTIAVVKVWYEQFLEALMEQKNLQQSNSRIHSSLSELRPKADDIIISVWNEVETSFKDLPDQLKREKAEEYGLVYIFRKNELHNQSFFQPAQAGIS